MRNIKHRPYDLVMVSDLSGGPDWVATVAEVLGLYDCPYYRLVDGDQSNTVIPAGAGFCYTADRIRAFDRDYAAQQLAR